MSDLYGPVQKRDILYGVKKTSTSELNNIAARFEGEGWLSDASDFLHQAQNIEGLKKLRKHAVNDGDVFLFLKISRFVNDGDAANVELLQCTEKAEALGKFRYAMKGYEKLGLEERREKVRAQIANDGDILAEAASTVFIPASEEEVLDETEEE